MEVLGDIGEVLKGGEIPVGALQQRFSEGAAFLGRIVWFVAILGVFGFAIYLFMFRYKATCLIKVIRGGKIVKVKTDKIREFVDSQGKRKLQLLFSGKTTPKPEQKRTYLKGKNEYYEFLEDDNGELNAMETNFDYVIRGEKEVEVETKSKKLFQLLRGKKETVKKNIPNIELTNAMQRAIPQERTAWLLSENKLLEEKLKSKTAWKEMAALALPYVGLVILFLIFFFGFKELGASMNNVAAQMGQVASSCLRIEGG